MFATHATTEVDPATGEINFIPTESWCGVDSFVYRVCDDTGLCDEATVRVLVVCDPFVVVDDAATTDEDTPVVIDVLANDDPQADPMCLDIISGPSDGTVVVGAQGLVTYTPNPAFEGIDCFTYVVCDTMGLQHGNAEVCVEVNGVENDIVIPTAFTPNGDGYNDVFEILNIEDYPNNELVIFNRWENAIHQARGYSNQWDGRADVSGQPAPDGTYFYLLRLDRDDPNSKTYSGYTTISR
jgi:gliding motility-associated-like protein